jgi:hypothetical protein
MDSCRYTRLRSAGPIAAIGFLLASCGGGGGGGAASSATDPAVPSTILTSSSGRTSLAVMTLNLWTNAVAWDPVNDVLQVVTGSSSPTQPSSLLSVNPHTGRIVASQALTTQPLTVAVSNDGQYVYVGFDMGGGVQRFIAKTLAPDLKIAVGDNTTYIQDIQVSPVDPRTIAVCAWFIVPFMQRPGVVVFDDAVMRPNMFQGTFAVPGYIFGYANVDAGKTSWSPDASTLYVFNLSQQGMYQLNVTAQGLSLADWLTWVPSQGIGGRIVGHVVYIDGGQVVDLTGPVQVLGRFPGGYTNQQYRAELLANNKSFSVEDHYNAVPTVDAMILWASDTTNYSTIDSLIFPGITSATEGKLYSWGTEGIAWGDSGRLVIASGNFAQSGGAAAPIASPPVVSSGTAMGTVNPLSYQILAAAALDVAADKCQNLYVSTSGGSGFHPNSVVAIDPANGMAKTSVYAGSEPYYLAVADDCSAVYAGLAQSSSVVRINVASMGVDETIPLPANAEWGFATSRSLSVAPGAPHSVAVATETSGTGCLAIDNNVMIFDDATARPIAYSNPNDAFYAVRGVAFGATASALYGFSLDHSDVLAFTLDGTGITNAVEVTQSTGNFPEDGGRFINFDALTGRIYDQLGNVFDTRANKSVGPIKLNVGPFTLASACGTATQAMTTDQTTGKVFFVTWLGGQLGLEIDSYDESSLALLETAQIPFSDAVGDFGPVLRLVRPDSQSLALVTSTGYLVLLHGPMLAP